LESVGVVGAHDAPVHLDHAANQGFGLPGMLALHGERLREAEDAVQRLLMLGTELPPLGIDGRSLQLLGLDELGPVALPGEELGETALGDQGVEVLRTTDTTECRNRRAPELLGVGIPSTIASDDREIDQRLEGLLVLGTQAPDLGLVGAPEEVFGL